MKTRNGLLLVLTVVVSLSPLGSDENWGHASQQFVVYYVDSQIGNDAYSCETAQTPDTPKQSVAGVLQCNPGPGDTVKFRGTFTQTIAPTTNGEIIYAVQKIQSVSGAQVAFEFQPEGLTPEIDYVTIYGSRKGNSGAFRVTAVSGRTVTVDTSALPTGKFLTESASDPGDLEAAILRPVLFTAWDLANPPLWRTSEETFHSVDKQAIMVSYLHSDSLGELGNYVWPAFEIDGTPGGNADYHVFDHLLIEHAETGIATEFEDFHTNYSIIQHCTLQHIGYPGNASDEIIYWGNAYHPDRHMDFCQIMYNKVGPHNSYPVNLDPANEFAGDGIELKPSAHNCTVFGNEIVGTQAINGCDDAPLRVSGPNTFVSNNYIHDINPQPDTSRGCGISLISTPEDGGAEGSIISNNIIANVKQFGIRILDTDDVQILNNLIYNIFPFAGCEYCTQDTVGILVQNNDDTTENIIIRNNIVYTAPTGIGRYEWTHDLAFSATSDHNIVFGAQLPYGRDIPQSTTDLIADPGLIDPENGNFAIGDESIARDSGINLTDVFLIDKHDADNPAQPDSVAITIRDQTWDRGPYELMQPSFGTDTRRWRLVVVGLAAAFFVIATAVVAAIRSRGRMRI
jgi:hypothetical protein